MLDFPLFCIWIVTALFPICSQFVKQPGDVALTAIPGYPLSEYIPCILERVRYVVSGWERTGHSGKAESISDNRTLHHDVSNVYELDNDDPWDYSLLMKVVPPTPPQLRCYVLDEKGYMNYSSWSNITYSGMFTLMYYTKLCFRMFTIRY